MTIVAIEPGIYLVDDGQRRWTVAVAGPPEARWVSVNGIIGLIDATGGSPERRTRRSAAAAMAAPMPATVTRIAVAEGQAVKAGDTVLVLEAMKMELSIRAAKDGRVARIRCAVGELVQPGVDLVEIE